MLILYCDPVCVFRDFVSIFSHQIARGVALFLLHAQSDPMPTKIAASWLIVLILSPFTAPFSTCDLGSLMGSLDDHGLPSAPAKTSVTNTPASLVPSARVVERVRPLRSVLASTSARTRAVAASSSRSIAAIALGSSHPTPPLILRL